MAIVGLSHCRLAGWLHGPEGLQVPRRQRRGPRHGPGPRHPVQWSGGLGHRDCDDLTRVDRAEVDPLPTDQDHPGAGRPALPGDRLVRRAWWWPARRAPSSRSTWSRVSALARTRSSCRVSGSKNCSTAGSIQIPTRRPARRRWGPSERDEHGAAGPHARTRSPHPAQPVTGEGPAGTALLARNRHRSATLSWDRIILTPRGAHAQVPVHRTRWAGFVKRARNRQGYVLERVAAWRQLLGDITPATHRSNPSNSRRKQTRQPAPIPQESKPGRTKI
jgi:hypothetical protein